MMLPCPPPCDPQETEVKLRVPSAPALAPALATLGFTCDIPSQVDRSVLWDRAGELRAQGGALRLRRYGDCAWLTWKGPRSPDPLLKIRPERETAVAAPDAMEAILRALGYAPTLAMEKRRELWRRAGLLACLDQTPFGDYLELEGAREAILPCMEALGLGPELAETRSYPELFRLHGLA